MWFLPFQPRHWPNKAALLELHLRGPEPCPELGMASPAFQSHSALGPERVQAFKLKSVHRFMLLTHTQRCKHTRTDFLSLHSRSFPKAAGTGSSGIGANPTADKAYQALQK